MVREINSEDVMDYIKLNSDYPKVSILIPCYNAEQWIAGSIESTLNQIYPNKEIIVIDDGSTDRSLEIIKSFDGRIKWETGPNRGANVARNRLLELSQGEWLQYLDADDYLEPNKIMQQIEFSKKHIDADIIYSPVIVEESFMKNKNTYLLEMLDKEDFYINFTRWGPLQTSGMLWKKSSILDVGGWKLDQVVCQEHELMLRLILSGKKFCLYNKENSVYRQWNESTVSRKNKKLTIEQRMKITERLEHYLVQHGLLDKKRLYAINLSRFESARNIYQEDRDFALQLIKKIKKSHSNFRPHGPAAPHAYRLIFLLFGLDIAEKIAKYTRWMR